MRRQIFILCALAGALHAESCLELLKTPREIQARGFPADADTIAALARSVATSAAARPQLRDHGWQLLSFVTTPVGPKCVEPIWESWENRATAFAPPPAGAAVAHRAIARELGVGDKVMLTVPEGKPPRTFSTTYFNPSSVKTIRDPELHLDSARQMETLRQALPDSAKRIQFQPSSVIVKPAWKVVSKKEQFLCLPVWDDQTRGSGGVPQSDWPHKVVVRHPSAPAKPPASFSCGGPATQVVSVDKFYHALLNKNDTVIRGGAFEDGDILILLGLHMVTKEVPDWIWSTFWWHPEPTAGPFGSGTRPGSLGKVWRNYRMDISVSDEIGKDILAEGPRIIFNPYMEGSFPLLVPNGPGGTSSNCISCHSRAVWPQLVVPLEATKVTRGAIDPSFYKDRLPVDFVWSIVRSLRN